VKREGVVEQELSPTVKRVGNRVQGGNYRPTVKREREEEQDLSTNSETGREERRGTTLRRGERAKGREAPLCAGGES